MKDHPITRRRALTTLGALGLAGAGGLTLQAPRRAHAQTLGQHQTVDEALKRIFGARPMKDRGGIGKLDPPLIAENGAVVPEPADVTLPLTPAHPVEVTYAVPAHDPIPV